MSKIANGSYNHVSHNVINSHTVDGIDRQGGADKIQRYILLVPAFPLWSFVVDYLAPSQSCQLGGTVAVIGLEARFQYLIHVCISSSHVSLIWMPSCSRKIVHNRSHPYKRIKVKATHNSQRDGQLNQETTIVMSEGALWALLSKDRNSEALAALYHYFFVFFLFCLSEPCLVSLCP